MKKCMAFLAATAMTLGLLSGCGSASDETTQANMDAQETAADESAQETQQEGTDQTDDKVIFTVGFDAEFPPYGYMDEDGAYTGFDLELAAEVCSRRGWELEKQPIDWDSKDFELSSGSIDCIWNGFTMNGREDAYTWSLP